MAFNDPILAGNVLIREAIQSPNFSIDGDTAVGWQIAKDGSATFNNVTIGSSSYDISNTGEASFEIVNANTDIIIAGASLLDELDALPKGLIAFGDSTSLNQVLTQWTLDSVTFGPNLTTAHLVASLAVGDMRADRFYRITVKFLILHSAHLNAYRYTLRYTTDGTDPTTGSAILNGSDTYQSSSVATTAADGEGAWISCIYKPPSDTEVTTFALSIAPRTSLAESANVDLSDPNTQLEFSIEDMGREDRIISTQLAQLEKFGGGSDPAPQTSHVKTYAANWSRGWNNSGADIYSTNDLLVQGFLSGYGTRRSWIGFPFSTIQSDLVGATVTKVEVYLYFEHWHFIAGGTASIGFHTSTATSAPSYNAGLDNLGELEISNWGRNVGKWVNLQGAGAFTGVGWKTGAHTGITLSAPSTNELYYGKARGNSMSNEPQLRITYLK
jgi:hypothetical protein